MTGEPEADRADAKAKQRLAAALRSSASQLAERAGGGVVLVFAAAPGDRSLDNAARLRAAAGFPMAESAREAAQALLANVNEVLESGSERVLDPLPSLGERGAGALLIVPMCFEGHSHGALVIGTPGTMEQPLRDAIEAEAAALALRLDHGHLQVELHRAESSLRDQKGSEEASTSEEVLSLSEALFAQDIELLRSNEKLGKIEKLKNDFIEKMSRELRTPLNSIIESIISVLTTEHENLSDASKAGLRSALDDGTEFLRTLQNILDLWRIKQRELPVEIQDVNFGGVVDEPIF